MKRTMFLMLFVVFLAVPVVSTAFTCGSGTCKADESCCDNSACCPSGKNLYCNGSNKCYSSISAAEDDCGDSYTICASPAEGKRQELILEPDIVLASSRDDFDQPCYVGGKYVGDCSLNKPYYNAFSGECYATLSDCKEADGDLQKVQGSGGCVRCGK